MKHLVAITWKYHRLQYATPILKNDISDGVSFLQEDVTFVYELRDDDVIHCGTKTQ